MNVQMIIAVIAAYIVKGMCGFANTLVFSTILSFSQSNINISPLELLVGYPSNFIIVLKERKNVSLKIWLPLASLVIAGSIPGIYILKTGDIHVIKNLFGIVVVLVGCEMLSREFRSKRRSNQKSNRFLLGLIGVVSGLLCGLFGIGALLAAYVGRTTEDSGAFKGNLCVVFIVENTFRMIMYIVTGIITLNTAKNALVLLPFMLFGLLFGMGLAKRIPEKIVKKIVIIMLIISGISLIKWC